jgi:beta-lactamase superfamily II metal-dependent hydrolase
MSLKTLPPSGFVYWPVGNGDSTTICVDAKTVMQVDLHHLECAEDDDDHRTPVVDRLVEMLPKVNGKPYLAVFVLTHPDLDHCAGFKELLEKVTIGELWFSPRVFSEFKCDLCDDACAFKDEAKRRVKQTIAGKTGAGDRVRIIGSAEVLDDDDFEGFPADRLTIPGTALTEIDSKDRNDALRIFVHAPFKDDSDGGRNDTSVGLQVTLLNDEHALKAMLLGDLCYPTIKQIFDISKADDVAWNVFLAPHHCSKSVMYWADTVDDDETLRDDIVTAIQDAALSPGYIVLSSDCCPASNKKGDNPPHALAKAQYEEIAPDGVLCTQTHGSDDAPEPIVFELTESGIVYSEPTAATEATKSLAAAIAAARGTNEPPQQRVGFGCDDVE